MALKTLGDQRKKRLITFSLLAILVLVVAGLMAWQAYTSMRKAHASGESSNTTVTAGWWIGSVSTVVLGLLAVYLGYRAAKDKSWSESVGASLEQLVSFTETLSQSVERLGGAGQRARGALTPSAQTSRKSAAPGSIAPSMTK